MEAVIILIINYWGYELNMEMPQYESSLVVMLQITNTAGGFPSVTPVILSGSYDIYVGD